MRVPDGNYERSFLSPLISRSFIAAALIASVPLASGGRADAQTTPPVAEGEAADTGTTGTSGGNTADATAGDKLPTEPKKKEEKKEKIRLGVIAAQGKFQRNTDIDVDSVGSAPGDEEGKITGSVFRKGRNECVARLMNSGEKAYSVSFDIIGTDERGNKVLTRNFSGTVKPKQFFERSVSNCAQGMNLALNLRSAKPL